MLNDTCLGGPVLGYSELLTWAMVCSAAWLADVTLRSGCSCPSSTWQENLEKISVMATLNMVKVCGLFACSLGTGDCNRLVLVSSCIHWFGYYEVTAICSFFSKESESFTWKANFFFNASIKIIYCKLFFLVMYSSIKYNHNVAKYFSAESYSSIEMAHWVLRPGQNCQIWVTEDGWNNILDHFLKPPNAANFPGEQTCQT